MDTVNLRVPSKLIRDFSIFSVSKVLIMLLTFLVLRLFRWVVLCYAICLTIVFFYTFILPFVFAPTQIFISSE